ncbi:MAG: cytochrome c1 [Azospira oryzae]|uniref:Cytochrome c1 n=1 Tax=Pelomicrobium methylotrophicum TaxID=2602750 RepID=A0A5C7EGY1_9PROT|nr:cytochrome c1 [Pelomicrobium methylotrophicum]PZP64871.1 MAG: cytochrome c1 [Azospira oryzae]PZP82835.1 MAG: cytochrome c1 [Azospira oryzae]TXF10555.1 cytochrome c1 [Pelomicrobium methylotrophicum]
MKTNNFLVSVLFVLLLAPALTWAAGAEVKLDKAPINLEDGVSLQRGARLFVNYCLNCHSASYMRYNRLTDLGLSEEDIEKYLIFTGAKVGSTMTVAMDKNEAKQWFGAAPPDLTVIARSRGPDWLYTYLRTFYRDDSRAIGWNNLTFPQVGMPHVLWELQGVQVLKEEEIESHGEKHVVKKLVLAEPGKLSKNEYDAAVADLVNYLTYMGEPARLTRVQIGIVVLLFLAVLFVLAYLLKKEFWKDVH